MNESTMSTYKIAWLPGDGVGNDVMEATRIVLDSIMLDAEYLQGDIGWEFWRSEGDAFPKRTVDLLRSVDAAMFGAITSKPVKASSTALRSSGCGRRSTCIPVFGRAKPISVTP
jgi:isocitrate/isopropylmalate dehydrogenase